MADPPSDRPRVQVGAEHDALDPEPACEVLDEVEVVGKTRVEDDVGGDLGDETSSRCSKSRRGRGSGSSRTSSNPASRCRRTATPDPCGGTRRRERGKYKEYDYVNRGGSFLYEPAGSVHTLTCVDADTEVWFHMYGANLNLDPDGNVESVTVGAGTLAAYYALCEAQGLPRPNVLPD
jgi:hypothetical protein